MRNINTQVSGTISYLVVSTFRFYLNRPRKLGSMLSKYSYNVYLIHIIVMGLIALALLDTAMPALLKYPVLALSTWFSCNLLLVLYDRVRIPPRKEPAGPILEEGGVS